MTERCRGPPQHFPTLPIAVTEDRRGGAGSRTRRIEYSYATESGRDGYTSPFEAEQTGNTTDPRRAIPAPRLNFDDRPVSQDLEYDWLGNLASSDDDAHGFYDRSLGTQGHNAEKPYQLATASNAGKGGVEGSLSAQYDDAGNLITLIVTRSTTAAIPCSSTGNGCSHLYRYAYDEVGRLVQARRWDSTSSNPSTVAALSGNPTAELRYRYDANDQRVIKRKVFPIAPAPSNESTERHTIYVFDSLELRRTTYSSSSQRYAINASNAVFYAMANGVRLARLQPEPPSTTYWDVPTVSDSVNTDGTPMVTDASGAKYPANLHVLLELGDHLGSTGIVIDKASGELVEKTAYMPFGSRENDYRPERWKAFREDYGFTGKEEDAEVGLLYFGKRFLSPQLGRWMTADPLAVHAPGEADLNLYAYVSGALLKAVDPVGLEMTVSGDANSDPKDHAAQKVEVLAGLQQLTSDRLELVDNERGQSTVRIAERSTDPEYVTGTRLVRDLVDSKTRTVNVAFADQRNLTHAAVQGSKASADGRSVDYDPSGSLALYERNMAGPATTKRQSPGYFALGHELVHIWRRWNDIDAPKGNIAMFAKYGRDWSRVDNTWTGPTGRQYTERIEREEAETIGLIRCERIRGFVPTENAIRREHGVAPRAAYATPSRELAKQSVRWNPFDRQLGAEEEQ